MVAREQFGGPNRGERLPAGVAWLGCGLLMAWAGRDHALLVGIGAIAIVVGFALGWNGARDFVRERAFNAERARAKQEWEDLRRGAAEAERAGRSFEEWLRNRGYRVDGVIHWIVHDLGEQHTPEQP